MATDILFPEWNVWNQFLLQAADGLRLDALDKSHPIEVEIQHARSVVEVFDAVCYKKGSAVIRMLENYLGSDIFKKSLSAYIRRYQGQNAKTEDLWGVLSEESGMPIDSMMKIWTKKTGYPVINVKLNDHILELKQSQFLSSGPQGDGQWIVPITLSLSSYKRRKIFLLEKTHERIDISEPFQSIDETSSTIEEKDKESRDENLWIKVDIDQGGFYRVNYEDKLAVRLRKAIQDNFLLATDKFGILDDTYALSLACEQSLSSLLLLMDVYKNEVCYNILKISRDAIPDSVDELKQYFINLQLFSAERLGWDSVAGEEHSSSLLRGEILQALAAFDHDETQQEALRRFQILLDDEDTSLLSADTRRVVYVSVMRNASAKSKTGLESLLCFYRRTDVLQEKERILRSIASSPDPNIVQEVLNLLLSDEIRDQDIIYVLAG